MHPNKLAFMHTGSSRFCDTYVLMYTIVHVQAELTWNKSEIIPEKEELEMAMQVINSLVYVCTVEEVNRHSNTYVYMHTYVCMYV